MEPLISIIIPAYNRAHLIEETLDSILTQSYTNWECIVIDDHSTDNTYNRVSEIAINDARIRIFKRPNNRSKGPSSCRNYGFELSKGEFINWFDSDDIMMPNKLEIDLININNGGFDFTISQSSFFNDKSKVENGFWNKNLMSENLIDDFIVKKVGWGVNSPLWRKSSLITANLKFNENLMTSDDYLYHIQALIYKLNPVIIDEVLVSQRQHNNRQEHFKIKSPFKAEVNLFLLEKSISLNLMAETITFLNSKSIQILVNLVKHKKWKTALNFSLTLNKISNSKLNTFKVIKLIVIGGFYKCFNIGYILIKY